MHKPSTLRFIVIAAVLLLGVTWAFASTDKSPYAKFPNAQYIINANQLQQRMNADESLVIVDVRNDKHFDGKMIPGAIRLPWSTFRLDQSATNTGGNFIGSEKAQQLLGEHGIFRNDTVILYDSVAHDGGATASYLFWVLDLLGHKNMAILERGIDGWIDADGKVVNSPAKREPLLYQAPAKEIKTRKMVDDIFINRRLGDPYYQILDVRSQEEYLGEALNEGLDGTPLKAGHIPGAVNINYKDNWSDKESKGIKSYAALAELYRGLNPEIGVITYCHSARRSSFTYYILRLMGFKDLMLYDNSWYSWGRPEEFFPVETRGRALPGQDLPSVSSAASAVQSQSSSAPSTPEAKAAKEADSGGKKYISCGG
ncbi:MAG: rhodanese-like domain-containing protein [Desulfuromonadaceae bacterium]